MKGVKHISASSTQKFVECPAHWLHAYDDDLKFNTRNEYTDVGTLVHGALELWRNPQNGHPVTYEALEACFREVCAKYQLVETMAVFIRGLEVLKKAYEIDTINKHLPMHLGQTLYVELEIKDYFGAPYGHPAKWIRPLKGFIDRVVLIRKPNDPAKIIVVFEDYKTGRAKSWAELTEEEIQPGAYMCYGLDVFVPWLQTQIDPTTNAPYQVERLVLLWSYVDHGIAIPIQTTDIDAAEMREYIGNIAVQMVNIKAEYEDLVSDIENALELGNQVLLKKAQKALSIFLAGHERVNDHCSWCPRKNVCENFNRQMQQEIVVDLQTVNMEKFLADRERFASIAKAAEEARKKVDTQFKAYLDHSGTTEIVVGDRLWNANTNTSNSHSPAVVAELLGTDFVLNAAKITQDAVEKEIARIATFDPVRAQKVKDELDRRIIPGFGARIVRSRKLKPSEIKKLSKEQKAS